MVIKRGVVLCGSSSNLPFQNTKYGLYGPYGPDNGYIAETLHSIEKGYLEKSWAKKF